MNRKTKHANTCFRVTVPEAMKEALEEEIQRRLLDSIPATILFILSGYFGSRDGSCVPQGNTTEIARLGRNSTFPTNLLVLHVPHQTEHFLNIFQRKRSVKQTYHTHEENKSVKKSKSHVPHFSTNPPPFDVLSASCKS